MTTLMHPVRRAYGRKREVMPSHLPHSPSLRHLRKQARDLQRADPVALRLQAAQHTVAVSYGFRTWAELKHFVLALNQSAALVARYTGLPKRELDVLRGSGRVVPSELVLALRHPNPRVRFDCLALLDHLADESCFEAMIEATRDPVPRVRRTAVHALGCVRCKGPCVPSDIAPVLIALALSDPSWRVRCESALSLAQQPASDRTRETLARLVAGDPHPTVRERAAWALRLHCGEAWSYGRRSALRDYAPPDEDHRGLP
jgi:hypothetical protein